MIMKWITYLLVCSTVLILNVKASSEIYSLEQDTCWVSPDPYFDQVKLSSFTGFQAHTIDQQKLNQVLKEQSDNLPLNLVSGEYHLAFYCSAFGVKLMASFKGEQPVCIHFNLLENNQITIANVYSNHTTSKEDMICYGENPGVLLVKVFPDQDVAEVNDLIKEYLQEDIQSSVHVGQMIKIVLKEEWKFRENLIKQTLENISELKQSIQYVEYDNLYFPQGTAFPLFKWSLF